MNPNPWHRHIRAELLGTRRYVNGKTRLEMCFEQASFLRPQPPENISSTVVDDDDFQLLWPRIHVQAVRVVQPSCISRDQDRLRSAVFCSASPTAVLKQPSIPATPRLAWSASHSSQTTGHNAPRWNWQSGGGSSAAIGPQAIGKPRNPPIHSLCRHISHLKLGLAHRPGLGVGINRRCSRHQFSKAIYRRHLPAVHRHAEHVPTQGLRADVVVRCVPAPVTAHGNFCPSGAVRPLQSPAERTMQRTFHPTHTSSAWCCSRHRVVCSQRHLPPAQTVPPTAHNIRINWRFAEGPHVNQDPWIVATQCVHQPFGLGISSTRMTGTLAESMSNRPFRIRALQMGR